MKIFKNSAFSATLLLFVANFLLYHPANAQSTEMMSYQAVIRDADNNLLSNQTIGMQISIIQGDAFGESVYVETQTATTTANGLISIEIGGNDATVLKGDLAAIDWANGPYFIKTETDPTGGSSYTISGTSQLMSVPYAFYAKSAETISGGISETDPVFMESKAASITEMDISNLENLSGVNTGDQDLSSFLTSETDPSVPAGTQNGQMQYWNGSEWVIVPAGSEGQVLKFEGGAPTWKTEGEVENPSTGKIWMDKNLGALRIATASGDINSYGDLYQWGRGSDGHQLRTSGTTSTLSNSDTPEHGDFIINSTDWRSPQNDNLWQGLNGTNNPCPAGYRLPTEAEWAAERTSWTSYDAAGAFTSPLKLPVAGFRTYFGTLFNEGRVGHYWSSTIIGSQSRDFSFRSGAVFGTNARGDGRSVRCIKD